jgi:hypothetical protein
VRYGLDASAYGGCIAQRGRRAGVTSYACLDGADTATPLAVMVPVAHLGPVASLPASGGDPATHGTLVIQTIDAAGAPVNDTSVSFPDGKKHMIDSGWQLDTFEPYTVYQGIAVIADAFPGEYSVRRVGFPSVSFYFGGAEPGTITTMRVRVP